MSEALITALNSLDTGNDDHWTQDGLPRLDILKTMTGGMVTREDINQVMPGFSRDSASSVSEPEAPEAAAEEPQSPEPAQASEPDPTPEPEPVVEPQADPTPAPSTVVNETELDKAIAKAEATLEAAKVKADKASEEVRKCTTALDTLINKKAVTQKTDQADMIKKFQESQRKQRESNVKMTQEVAELVKSQMNG